MEEHPQARTIVDTLSRAGFIAYYAGGWVRDYLLRHPSDDIDIATNAPPETIQALFPHTVPIGIAFGIVLVILEGRQYEVATFRQDRDYSDGRRPNRIEFATAIEDARRRDFTINGMFYDPIRDEILDYVEGKEDLNKKIVRAIGDPHERIKEDRLRMIRGVRYCCRFGFTMDPATEKAIRAHATELLPAVAIERIVQEFAKGRLFGSLRPMISLLHKFGLLASIFPALKNVSQQELDPRIAPMDRYPAEAPLIASLLLLFPSSSLQEQIDLCKRLKLSNADLQFVTFLFRTAELIAAERQIENVEWAYFYAHPLSSTALQIIAAHRDPHPAELFLKHHQGERQMLERAIDRIHRRDPVVKSSDLQRAGIEPGVKMGLLLKEAERISFNEQIYESEPVIERLRASPLW